ncbi:hypothetical protein GOB13_23220 [Sinorhizobium meliloti]|uniref:hypothetical protein n=1 Tax=Rhizobium meliloti TaxID=382 RepID=UPI00299EEA56|nr:hypothetical protein [Sinorhizobium meliloti]MDX0084199.1 hypothetical protein [Sinorhizobium meliloti]MDX0469744.1 hypothetical protein [Sinorhizobium medicae]MDX1176949.1 hypothetical protein [Sinorhizobium medicae]
MSNTLSFELNKVAEWRADKAKRHPEDSRNQTAKILLVRLAEQTADEDVSQRYDALHEDESVNTERLSEARSEILGEIGFGWEPKHVDEVLERIINRATGKAPTVSDLLEVNRKRAEADAAATAAGKPANSV